MYVFCVHKICKLVGISVTAVTYAHTARSVKSDDYVAFYGM